MVPFTLMAQWTPAIKMSTHPIHASINEEMGQDMEVSTDTVHVVWWDQRTLGAALYYRRSIDTGATWNTDVPITDTTGSATRCAIAVSGRNIHVLWLDNRLGHSATYYKRSLDGGNTWGPDICLDSNTLFWGGISAHGPLVVVSLNKGIVDSTNVYFMRSLDNGTSWSTETQISATPGSGRAEDPAISTDGSYVHLSWNDDRNGNMEIYYRRSTDKGVTWGAETHLINNGTHKSYTSMLSLFDSSVVIPCGDNRTGTYNIFIKQSSDSGTNWGPDVQVTSNTHTNSYPYMVQNKSILHLLFYRIDDSTIMYMRSSDDGVTWGYIDTIGIGDQQPFLQYTGTVLHVIWSSRGIIYYMRNLTANSFTFTSVREINNSSNPAIFPNPATNNATINFGEDGTHAIELYDIAGRKISGFTSMHKEFTFSCGELSAGMYFVKVYYNDCNRIIKFLKQ